MFLLNDPLGNSAVQSRNKPDRCAPLLQVSVRATVSFVIRNLVKGSLKVFLPFNLILLFPAEI